MPFEPWLVYKLFTKSASNIVSVSAFIVYTFESIPLVSVTYTLILYVVPCDNPLNVYVLLLELTYEPLFIE